MSNKKKCTIAVTTIVLLLLIDQIIKIWVKLNMNIGEEIVIFNWFRISFIENRGMAFGMEIGSKLFLSLFRIVAVGVLTWYIYKRIKEGARIGYIIVLSMIYAGAAGNILDSLFLWRNIYRIAPLLYQSSNSTFSDVGRRLCVCFNGQCGGYVFVSTISRHLS